MLFYSSKKIARISTDSNVDRDWWVFRAPHLTLSWQRSLSYKNQWGPKSMTWFLYDMDIRHKRVKCLHWTLISFSFLLQELRIYCLFKTRLMSIKMLAMIFCRLTSVGILEDILSLLLTRLLHHSDVCEIYIIIH